MRLTNNVKPIIAVLDDWGSVCSALAGHGAITLEVDTMTQLRDTIAYVDGIVLTGGGDVNPKRYGAKPHPQNYGTSDQRDKMEFTAVQMARKRRIPMMGICRGHQILNVAHGGSLIQHLEDLTQVHKHEGTTHWVKLRKRSRVARAIGAIQLEGTSLHHQAVDRLGDGLVPVGWSPDGTVEMIESAPGVWPYVLGCQFHPEMDYHYDSRADSIFEHFADVARAKSSGRGDFDTRILVRAVVDRMWSSRKSYSFDADTGRYCGVDNRNTLSGHGLPDWMRDEYDEYGRRFAPEHGSEGFRSSELGSGYGDLWDEEYEEWAVLNDKNIQQIRGELAETDAFAQGMCVSAPCTTQLDCAKWGDCAAEAMANKAELEDRFPGLVKQALNPHSHTTKSYDNVWYFCECGWVKDDITGPWFDPMQAATQRIKRGKRGNMRGGSK
jgi:putative glutamine amidotransferase